MNFATGCVDLTGAVPPLLVDKQQLATDANEQQRPNKLGLPGSQVPLQLRAERRRVEVRRPCIPDAQSRCNGIAARAPEVKNLANR